MSVLPMRVRAVSVAVALLAEIAGCGAAAESVARDAGPTGSASSAPRDAGSPEPDASAQPDLADAGAPPGSGDAGADGGAGDATLADASAPLVHQAHWRRVDAGEDPFEDRPAQVVCPLEATLYEKLGSEDVLDVDTGLCNYLTVVQPTARSIAAGARVRVRLFHFDLNAPQPAEAHAAVQVDGWSVLDTRIPIPASGGLIAPEVVAPRAIAAGTPMYFHLHNHGQNNWALVEVSVSP